MPGLRRHPDGAMVWARPGRDDPPRGLRGNRADVPTPQPDRACAASGGGAHGLRERRRLERVAAATGGFLEAAAAAHAEPATEEIEDPATGHCRDERCDEQQRSEPCLRHVFHLLSSLETDVLKCLSGRAIELR